MKKKFLSMTILILVLVSILAGCGGQPQSAGPAPQTDIYTPVETQTIKKENLSNMSTLSGKVFPDKEIAVMPKAPGKVAAVNVKVGDKVNEKQVLLTLDREDIQKQVDSTKAAYDLANANYQMNLEKYNNAKLTYDRMKTLYDSGAISKKDLEQAELAASSIQLDLYSAQLSQAEVSYNQAMQNLQNTVIESPIRGIVSAVNVEAGEMASTAQPAVTIVDMDIVNVQIGAAENMISSLKLGQEVKIALTAIPGKEYTGHIENISPVADSKTQMYPVIINIDNKEQEILPGMFAKVEFSTDTVNDAIIVKKESIKEKEGKSYVYVVENDAAVEKEVAIGMDTGSLVEVISGLNEGENIIVKGQDYVENGTKVKIVRGDN
ncbi:macrolide export protein MacA [Oxobacter pfennigii]|uniref:Macrolide export protein MacA n=1 Tax=Oxobacter pfennigii TaxID=36849 RepID=A0A0P9AI52_9CLOT|nr:efflux RND transporter periplasmic adaptor subunit [Oxobacter pfennigii]KPU45134.1 macrolide export protein MacA [Oxobacter pfennigii]